THQCGWSCISTQRERYDLQKDPGELKKTSTTTWPTRIQSRKRRRRLRREHAGDLVDAAFSHPGAVIQRAAHPARMASPWRIDRPGVDGCLLRASTGKTIGCSR